MASRGEFLGQFLILIGEATGFFAWPPEYSEPWRKKQLRGAYKRKITNTASYAKRKGFVKQVIKNGKKFLSLTQEGQLEILLLKARVFVQKKWDGKWRLIIFDIPEDCRNQRSHLRVLLRRNNFIKLQASVFISPYALNREAIAYLKQSGLVEYIRIIKVEEMDYDKDLKKRFNLK
jgi:CRISPR-associated endonuclease Cas2